ncbi:hypothetical protein AYL99_03612 [Fonsecaea erecta]|uniref:Uncharacterized protein n=1 Tax=Fonsecaea erecta TaxID=1367422 RepID=A0A178ZNL8_9EURO|nr:hypothetical protein AYL99_03612 [Fonsecaea erecta]OAP61409.1 hypothetical protein AYL99_03612 [Fonsecaea erecta]
MGKAKSFFTGAKEKLTRTFQVFKRRHLFQHQGSDNLYSVHHGPEASSDDSDTEQLIQQDDHAAPAPPVLPDNTLISAEPQSTLKYVNTHYMDGSSDADYDSIADSAEQMSEEGHRRADDNIALRRIDSEVTTTKLPDNPDSDESATSSDAANTLANFPEAPEMSGEEGDILGGNLPEGRTLRHRHCRSLTDWLEGRTGSLSSAAPSSRHLSSGNSSTDTFACWRNRRPNHGLASTGESDPFLDDQPAPEPQPEPEQPAATTPQDLDNDAPFNWAEEYDKFSSDGKQRKVEQTAPGEFSLQPREYRLNTPGPRQDPEDVRVLKLRWRDQVAAARARVPDSATPVAAGNAYAYGVNVGAAQPVPFQPGAAVREVQIRMEAMHQAFWKVDEALRQLDRENQMHQQNVRFLVDRNQALEHELKIVRAAVRDRDAELEQLRAAVDIANQALQLVQRPHQSPQNGPSGNAVRSPPPVLRLTPPLTSWNRSGSMTPQTSSTQGDSGGSTGTVVHHEVAEQVFDPGADEGSSETSDIYGGDKYDGGDELQDDDEDWVDTDDSSEDDGEGGGMDLSYDDPASRPDRFGFRETASESALQDFQTRPPPERRPQTC